MASSKIKHCVPKAMACASIAARNARIYIDHAGYG